MTFLAPGFLVLLPLALLPLLRGGAGSVRGNGMTTPAGTPGRGLRVLALLALVLALGRPVLQGADERSHQVLLVDHRGSRAPAEAFERWNARLEDEDRRVLVEVGGALPAEALAGGRVERHTSADLAEALAHAVAAVPASARGSVSLVGSGLDAAPNLLPSVLELERRGIPLHVLKQDPLPRDLRVVTLRPGPDGLRVGATGALEVVLEGESQDALLTVSVEGVELDSVELNGMAGRRSIEFPFEPTEAGFVTVSAQIAGEGVGAGLERLLPVQDPLRVLALTDRTRGAGERLGELVGPGFDVDERSGPIEGEPLPDPRGYDLVAVDDRPAAGLPAAFQAQLAAAVQQDGVGLFTSGGRAAYGPGGWHDTPLASLLPVESIQKEEKRDPSVTLVIIIDTSGSMGGNRVQLAKEVSRLALKRLLPHDKAGIVEFYGAKRWAAPIQPASNHIELERALNRMQAGGGTVILPAIEEAWYGLKNVQTRYKHVLVLTDGGVEAGAFEPLLRAMADDGITISTVLIGGDAHSEFLVNLANWGKGRFYGVPNRFNLPEILLKQPASAKLPAWRPLSTPVAAEGRELWWGDLEVDSVPDLAGHVETRLAPGAEQLLSTAGGTRPILASWRNGLGRVSSFTSELVGEGAGDWAEWPERGALVARVLRRTARDLGGPFRWSVERHESRLFVMAERRDPADPAIPSAQLGDAELLFEERAPGWFVAERELSANEAQTDLPIVARALDSPRAERLVAPRQVPFENADPSNPLDLTGAARRTGGEFPLAGETSSSSLPVGGPEVAPGVDELRPLLALLALLSHLTSVYLRRRPVPSAAGVSS